MRRRLLSFMTFGVLVINAALATGVLAQQTTGNRQGQSGSLIQGSAGPERSTPTKGLEQCDAPLAAVAVVEPQDHVMQALNQYRLGSPTGLIRMMIQQSNDRSLGTYTRTSALQRNVGTLAEEAAAGGQTLAGAVFAEDDVLAPKIAGVQILDSPSDGARLVTTLQRTDEVVVIGQTMAGYVNVQSATGAGWVKVVLMSKP
jgi:hypothetical protein